jgi:single-stranded-DNA-specific exonuclease
MPANSRVLPASTASQLDRIALPLMRTPASGRRWVLRPFNEGDAAGIDAETGCGPALARILAARGVTAADSKRFLNPTLKRDLPDPSLLVDMDRAAACLADAIGKGEQVGVFGDYDVDGTCGSAVLKLFFDAIGVPLLVYLPDRITEGYGPSIEAFRKLKEAGARVIVTVDCGAAAHGAISAAASEGLNIIVLDHHQMDGPPPAGAVATVNPNRPDDRSGLRELSAAGVAFMAVVALNRVLRERGWFKEKPATDLTRLLDLVALGLVCDVMPMTGVARVLTAQGLKVLNGGGNQGLVALGARAGISAPAGAYELGFILGPRINAAGRIGHAQLALELLTTKDAAKRTILAERLHVLNAERQLIEQEVQAAAMSVIERGKLAERAVIVASGEGWHPGVIGIVAGRLKDLFDKPTVVIGFDGGIGKGSARSLSGVDIGLAIRAAKEAGLLEAGGGHGMAAGLTIRADQLAAFREFLEARLADEIRLARESRARDIDAVIAPSAVSAAFANEISKAGPFGPGNPEPVFVVASMRVGEARPVGKDHLSCRLISECGAIVQAIAFRAAEQPLGAMLLSRKRLHLAGRIKADSWRGGAAGQLQIIDAAEAAD